MLISTQNPQLCYRFLLFNVLWDLTPLTYVGCCLHDGLVLFQPTETKRRNKSHLKMLLSWLPKHTLPFLILTIRTSPLHPVWHWRAVTEGPFLVKSGFLLLWFRVRGQQSVSLILILLQELLCLILRQLHILQLLQWITLLLWKTAAHWRMEG